MVDGPPGAVLAPGREPALHRARFMGTPLPLWIDMTGLDAAKLSRSERRRSLAAAIACISVFAVTVGLVTPLVSLILEARGIQPTTIGAIAAMPSLAILVTTPLIPWFVRRLGLRGFLSLCIAGELVLVLLLPLLDHLAVWFVLRGLMGATGAGLFVASETWINEVAEERSRGRVLAIYGAILSGSFALGPFIISITGTEGWLPFLVAAAFIAGAGLPLLWSGRLSPAISGQASFGVFSFVLVAPTLAAAILLSGFKEMSMAALLPVYGVRSGLSVPAAAVMLTAVALGALAFQLPIGWAADRMNRYLLLIIVAAAALVGALLLPLIVTLGGLALWLGLAFWGGAFSGVYVVAMVLVGERFRGPDLVTASAAFGLLWGSGGLAGPILSGSAMDIWGSDGFPGLLAAATALFVLLAVYRRLRRSSGSGSRAEDG